MNTTIHRDKVAKKQPKTGREPASGAKKPVAPRLKVAAKPGEATAAGKLRASLVLTQSQFARLLAVSVRSLATLEGGTVPTEPVTRRLTELDRLTTALSEVIEKKALGAWLQTPNPAFDGLKPVEVIERGESDRLWEMVYFLRSGVPS